MLPVMRRGIAATFVAGYLAAFGLGVWVALAQAPPPVPALPDTMRQTSYVISGSTCACAVGFQIYGDGGDIDNWIKVTINGAPVLSTDSTFGWVLSSPTGPLTTIPRPITDAILTFNSAQTGTVVITGAERPRRLQTFAENQGVTARQLNQVFNTAFAELREAWDRAAGAGAPLALPAIQISVRSSNAVSVTLSTATDYFLCLDPTSNAITVHLPASPPVGQTYLIKDCTGQAAVHTITISPASGNIDGAISLVMSVPYQSTAVTFTGLQWSIN
jgi:hypothetical protein